MSDGGRILIVEASGFLARILKPALDAARLGADSVRSLREAVDYIQRRSPGLILVDLDLPASMSVEKACRLIKQIPRCRAIPIVVVGVETEDLEARREGAGADAALTKPFTPGAFLRWLAEHENLLDHVALEGREPEGAAAVAAAARGAAASEEAAQASEPPRPRTVPGAGKKAEEKREEKAEGTDEHRPGGPVLVIDDSSFLTALLKEIFRRLGVGYRSAGSVGEGAAALKDVLPSAVFIDLNLPDMQGDDACRFLRSIPSCVSLPIFLMSAATEAELDARAHACGANGFIRKPFTADEFVAFLRGRHLVPETPAPPAPKAPALPPSVPVPAPVPPAPQAPPLPPPPPAPELGDSPELDGVPELPPLDFSIQMELPDMDEDFKVPALDASLTDVPVMAVERPDEPALEDMAPEVAALGEVSFGDQAPAEIVPEEAVPETAAPAEPAPAPAPLGDGLDLELGELELDDLPAVLLDPAAIVEDDAGSVKVDERRKNESASRLESHVRAGKLENRIEATLSIGRRKVLEGLPVLVAVLEDEDEDLMAEACWSLGELGDRAALPALLKLLRRRELLIKSRALEAIGKVGDPSAAPHVIACLSDAADELKMPIVRCLARLGGADACKALTFLSQDYSRKVAQEATAALRALTGGDDDV